MFKLVAIFACFACVCAAPLDTKVDGSKNLTEKSDAKAVTYYGDAFNPRPVFYSIPPVSKPIMSSPLRPSPLLQSPLLPSPYMVDAKTAHLRPQLYQSQLYHQPQLYTYPIQSYQYPQSVYSYSSYQPSYQTYYGAHGYYKQGNEEPMAPTTRIVKPQIPMEQVIPRDGGYWTPYTLPQDNGLEGIAKRDIDMEMQPSYLKRMQLEPTAFKSARSADDFDYQSPEDDLYYVMNKYDPQPVVAKGADDLDTHVNSLWMPPVFNSPILPTNLRDNRDSGKPYSSENIFGDMTQFYISKYMEQMAKANRNLPAAKNAEGDDKVLQAVAEEIVKVIKSKKTEPVAAKVEEQKVSTTAPAA